jgi:hypothetical protein
MKMAITPRYTGSMCRASIPIVNRIAPTRTRLGSEKSRNG